MTVEDDTYGVYAFNLNGVLSTRLFVLHLQRIVYWRVNNNNQKVFVLLFIHIFGK